MAAILGTPQSINWGTNVNPAAVGITVPSGATAAIWFWTHFTSTNNAGLASVTLSVDGAPDQTFEIPSLTTAGGEPCTGVAVWFNPTAGAQNLDPAWDAAPGDGPTSIICYVNDSDTSSLRMQNGGADPALGANGEAGAALSVNLTTVAGDLVLKWDSRFDTTAPGLIDSFSNVATQANNNGYSGRISSIVAAGTSQTCNADGEAYSGLIAISIPDAAASSFELDVDPAGALVLTPRTLVLNTSIGVTSTPLTLTPRDVTLTATGLDSFTITVDSADITLTGQEIPFQLSTVWTPTTLTLTGRDITLTATGVDDFTIAVDSGDLTLSGSDVTLVFENNFTLGVDSSPLTLAPQDITLTLQLGDDYILAVDTGSLTLTGRNIDLIAPIQVTAGGHGSVMRHSRVVIVSASGRVKWKDYIPVKIVTPAQSDVNTFNFLGALGVEVLSSGVGLQEWVDYIPVVEVVDSDASRWRTESNGWIPIVEIS